MEVGHWYYAIKLNAFSSIEDVDGLVQTEMGICINIQLSF